MAAIDLLDPSVDELEATLSPNVNLRLLANAANNRRIKEADSGEPCEAACLDAERSNAGLPMLHLETCTGHAQSANTTWGLKASCLCCMLNSKHCQTAVLGSYLN
jgi:hypothetical protein